MPKRKNILDILAEESEDERKARGKAKSVESLLVDSEDERKPKKKAKKKAKSTAEVLAEESDNDKTAKKQPEKDPMREELIHLSETGELEKSVAYIRRASKKIIEKIYAEQERQRLTGLSPT